MFDATGLGFVEVTASGLDALVTIVHTTIDPLITALFGPKWCVTCDCFSRRVIPYNTIRFVDCQIALDIAATLDDFYSDYSARLSSRAHAGKLVALSLQRLVGDFVVRFLDVCPMAKPTTAARVRWLVLACWVSMVPQSHTCLYISVLRGVRQLAEDAQILAALVVRHESLVGSAVVANDIHAFEALTLLAVGYVVY